MVVSLLIVRKALCLYLEEYEIALRFVFIKVVAFFLLDYSADKML